ncbi:hypothetical protein TcasGA2_TC034691 [Tribolium castaneum]|uniref:MD-2-related lipid-recognition domain-containing protein n=1 Tax=Tribolium castaneum TaxID=7070 RepID=A0A139WI68_TRICA|nr:PREDICTED: uncharacterized protein LOC107397894 [Tribolium castaneum]KYB27636.1 hypothetical protein TcasGA2_TC034691 [Tribolium castaneum]|eukprot:XP_015835257.1 PREDICTED: uncharacterized protein LOC107397894 [Tribolium castaneum]
MSRHVKCFVFILIFTFLHFGVNGKKKMLIRKFDMCDPHYDYPITLETTFKEQGGHQYLNITAFVNTPLGLNQSMNATFEYSENQDNFMPLFKFSRSDFCDFLNKDLGAFWFELQKQIGVAPRTCPIGNGRYNLKNYELPMFKLNFPLPSGFIRTILNILETKTNKMISCVSVLLEVMSK